MCNTKRKYKVCDKAKGSGKAMTEETKAKVLKVFEEAYPQDLSIVEVSRRSQLSEVTGAMYVRILEAEGKIEFTRKVGRAKMFRLKKDRVTS